MSFGFVGGWQRKVLHDPLDVKMTEMMQVGVQTASDTVHVRTGHLKSTIGATYNKSTKTVLLHADAPYAWIEEMRPPVPSHSYMGPGAKAMAGFWGGTWNIQIHFANAAPMGRNTTLQDVQAKEKRWRKQNFNILQRRKVQVITRRWHRRYDDAQPADLTPIV